MTVRKKIGAAFVVAAGAAVFFAVAGGNGAAFSVKSVFFDAIGAVSRPVFNFAKEAGDIRRGILHYREIVDENNSLRDSRQNFLERLVLLEETEKENAELREALGLRKEIGRPVIPAHTAGLFRDDTAEVLVIDKGTEDGVAKGDAVVGGRHNIVGRVVDAYGKTAKVILATSQSEKFDAVFAGKELRVVAEGIGAGEFALGLVPGNAEVAVGDMVLASAGNAAYPAGFIAGEVTRVGGGETKVFRDVVVRSLFDPYRDAMVYVVK